MAGTGAETPDHLGVAKDIDIYTSSLSKGLGFVWRICRIAEQRDRLLYKQIKVIYLYVWPLPSFLVEYTQAKIESKDRARQRRKLKKKHYKNYKRPHRDRL